MSAREELEEARRAWRMKQAAEFKLARLRRYSRMTHGMKAEADRAASDLTDAWATLQRVLGAIPPQGGRSGGGHGR